MTQKYNILISRTDSIGDVILSLPMAGILKNKFPNATISFLGKNYTRDIINACTHIEVLMNCLNHLLKSR
jgi:heptosyltransferase-3